MAWHRLRPTVDLLEVELFLVRSPLRFTFGPGTKPARRGQHSWDYRVTRSVCLCTDGAESRIPSVGNKAPCGVFVKNVHAYRCEQPCTHIYTYTNMHTYQYVHIYQYVQIYQHVRIYAPTLTAAGWRCSYSKPRPRISNSMCLIFHQVAPIPWAK